MFIYKYLEIDNHREISSLIEKYILDKTDVLNKKLFWKFLDVNSLVSAIPEIQDVFSVYNLKITTAAAIYRKPFSQGGIHVDSSEFYRVLFPVSNCQGSKTKFFKFEQHKFRPGSGVDGDKNLSLIPGFDLEFIDEFELSKPVLFNPKIPHGVYCNLKSKQPRISLTLGFDRDPKKYLVS